MKLILITPPQPVKNEIELLHSFFENGLQYLHIRKPSFTETDFNNYIQAINSKYHTNIIIHSHYNLLQRYTLKGIHFTEKTKHLISNYSNFNIHKSISTHHISEWDTIDTSFSYIFYSPVFTSISKPSHSNTISHKTLMNALQNTNYKGNIIALGGINQKNINNALALGFNGIAVLGAIWYECNTSNISDTVNEFIKLKNLCQQHDLMY